MRAAMKNMLAIDVGRLRRAVDALLHYEPKVLRGLTWSHFGYVALLAIGFAVVRALGSRMDSPERVAWYWIPLSSICGLTVLLCAVVLTNIKLHGIPRPVILGIAVVAGCML